MQTLQNIQNIIGLARNEEYKVCIWGAGFMGKGLGYELVKKLDIGVDCYCDNNEKLWGKEIIDGIVCIDYHMLLGNKDKVVYIILVGAFDENRAVSQLMNLGIKYYVTLSDILRLPSIKHNFFPFMGQKTVAYTCIIGNYDDLSEPGIDVREQYDYYLISDKKPMRGGV